MTRPATVSDAVTRGRALVEQRTCVRFGVAVAVGAATLTSLDLERIDAHALNDGKVGRGDAIGHDRPPADDDGGQPTAMLDELNGLHGSGRTARRWLCGPAKRAVARSARFGHRPTRFEAI